MRNAHTDAFVALLSTGLFSVFSLRLLFLEGLLKSSFDGGLELLLEFCPNCRFKSFMVRCKSSIVATRRSFSLI